MAIKKVLTISRSNWRFEEIISVEGSKLGEPREKNFRVRIRITNKLNQKLI